MPVSIANQWATFTGSQDLEITTTPTVGNWLVALVVWKTSDGQNPLCSIADGSSNLWTLLYSRTAFASADNTTDTLHAQVWCAPNVQYQGVPNLQVYLALTNPSSDDQTTAVVNIVEVAGMTNGYLTVDSVATGTAHAATALSLSVPTPGAQSLMVAVAGSDNAAQAVTITSAGWAALTAQNPTGPDAVNTPMWQVASTAQTASWSTPSAVNWAGVAVAIRVAGTAPAQTNPLGSPILTNWPVLQFQAGLGYGPTTPLSTVFWTDLSPRFRGAQVKRGIPYELDVAQAGTCTLDLLNKDGAFTPRAAANATANAAGTTTTILLPSTTVNLNVSDFFRLQTSGALKELNVFQVTAISTVGGTSTVTFARADGAAGGALVATALNDQYVGIPIDIYIPVRILATWSGKTYPVYTGWVERWPQTWMLRNYGITAAAAVDALGTLTANDVTAVRGEIMRRKPTHYWPLNDASGASAAQNTSGMSTVQLVHTKSKYGTGASSSAGFGTSTQQLPTGGVVGDPGSAWSQSGLTVAEAATKGYALIGNGNDFPSIAGGVTILGVIQVPAAGNVIQTGTFDPTIVALRTSDPGAGTGQGSVIKLSVNHGTPNGTYFAYPQVTVWDKSTHAATVNNTNLGAQIGSPAFDVWALTFNQSTWKAYAQGGYGGNVFSGTCNLVGAFSSIDLGGEADGYYSGKFNNWTLCHVAVFARMLSAGEIQEIKDVVQQGYYRSLGETTGQMIARKLNTVGWRGARALGLAGDLQVSAEDTSSTSVVNKINTVASFEDARAFVGADGTFVFRGRQRTYAQTPVGTLGDGGGEVPYRDDIHYDFDLQYLYDQVLVTNFTVTSSPVAWFSPGTASFLSVNQSAVARYGTQSLTRNTRLTNNFDAYGLAYWLLGRFSTPKLRIQQVVIDPASNSSVWPFALSAGVCDLVNLNRRPLTAPMISAPCAILQVQHDIAPGKWNVTFGLGAANPTVLTTNDPTFGIVGSNVIGA